MASIRRQRSVESFSKFRKIILDMLKRLILILYLSPCVVLSEPDIAAEVVVPTRETADDTQRLRDLIDTLNQSSLQEAFRLLTTDYINHNSLSELEINRAALQGMLRRLDFGAMLLTKEELSQHDSPFLYHQAIIANDTAYVRFGKFSEECVAQLDQSLEEFSKNSEITHLIIDLRSPQAQAEFSMASAILGRFRPPNELLFKIRRPGNDRPTLFVSRPVKHSWNRELILLVDAETGNVGEIIAAVLKRETNCLVIGEKTPGLTVEYRDVPIGDDRILRYAIAEVVFEDDSSIFRNGIKPDIVTPTPYESKRSIFRETERGTNLIDCLVQKERPRLNEAALVEGIDPEIDYYLLRSNNKPTPWDKPPLQDRALQQAADLLNATAFINSDG